MRYSILNQLVLFVCKNKQLSQAEIARAGGLEPILRAAASDNFELQSQAARAMRNLSVNPDNKEMIKKLDGVEVLKKLSGSDNERIQQQATRALNNLTVQ
jgi:hypothetical protein